jgi:hypothetical protein
VLTLERSKRAIAFNSGKSPKKNARGLPVLDELKAVSTITPPENMIYEQIMKGVMYGNQ